MNHDLLCPMTKGKLNPLWKAAAPIYDLLCECELIAQVREDTLAKAIAAMEWLHDHEAPHDAHKDALWNAMTALRALQEKP